MKTKDIIAFPWLDTIEMNVNKPYYLLEPLENTEQLLIQEYLF